MAELKQIVAKNITDLRLSRSMTQLQLAETLHYSDKAVSKWERGESLPDIAVLKEIAELFGITLDDLVREEHPEPLRPSAAKQRSRGWITGMCILLVWLIATFIFVVFSLLPGAGGLWWLAFVWAVPVSMIVWLIMNSIWFNQRLNYVIISLLVWSFLAAVYLTFLSLGMNPWLIFILGIPGQLIILMWSRLKNQ